MKKTLTNIGLNLTNKDTISVFGLYSIIDIRHSILWYIIVLILIIIMDIKLYYIFYTNYRDINKNQKGSERWTKLEEIQEQYPSIPLKFKKPYETFYGKGGIPICHYGTFYDSNMKLCNIENGIIYIDRTATNNLIIGITRSCKGEMYVYSIIDIYSRAENKEYYIRLDKEGKGTFCSSNIYYDYRNGGNRKTDTPVTINEDVLNFKKAEFLNVIQNYENEYGKKLKIPEIDLENNYDFYKYVDSVPEGANKKGAEDIILISTSDKVQTRKNTQKGVELKLLSKEITIFDTTVNKKVVYEFDQASAESKKNALDQAFLYLQQINSKLSDSLYYEKYMEALGIEQKAVYKDLPENKELSEDTMKQITDENNSIWNKSDVFEPVDEESEKEETDTTFKESMEESKYISLLQQIAKDNNVNDFKFTRNYQASMVISDPKLELFKASKPILELRGYNVFCINLVDPYESSSYNPIQLITDTYKKGQPAEASAIARSLATSIFAEDASAGAKENAFFYDNAAFLTAALIMSEVIDQLRADEESNKVYLREHIEATERFEKLSPKEKERIENIGQELEQLIRKRSYSIKDSYEKIMIDREIEKLQNEVKGYNYKKEEFRPRHENEKKINLPNILLKFSKLAERTLPPEVEGSLPKNALDVYFESRDNLDIARNLYSAIKLAGGEVTKGSIYSTVLSKLTGFMDDKIKKMTAFSSFHLEDVGFGERPMAIFIGQPDYDASNSFIASIFISQLYYANAKEATRFNGGKCKREVVYLLDEFGNIPTISNMASMITVCLGRNIRFNLVVQAYSQLDKLYGEHDSDTIYGNCGNQIYILTDNKETAEQFSELIGSETIVNVSRMGSEVSFINEKQYTENTEEKPLKNKNELMGLTEGSCIIKRVMMRKDLKGRDVVPRPIFNDGETRFPLRYQYMSDWFNPDAAWESLNADSCSKLNLAEYVSDFDELLKRIEYYATEEYQEAYKAILQNYEINKKYEIGEFISKQEICKKLVTQIPELEKLSEEQLFSLTIEEIENYYIDYESNLSGFRQRMYEIKDWSRKTEDKVKNYTQGLVQFFRALLGDNQEEVWLFYNFEDENTLNETTINELIDILEEQEVGEKNIAQFRTAIDKFKLCNNG